MHQFGSSRASRVLVLVPGYIGGAGDFTQIARQLIARYLGLRTWHRADINVPLYAEQTSLTHGTVLRGARRLFHSSHIPRATYVNAPNSYHLDPLLAAPSKNLFLRTVVRFLKSL